ncbi:MAG TPA: type II toxin-antitoxin system VapB family antitoxin [Caulobacteraceae bacterium]|jgi:hypothetical protein
MTTAPIQIRNADVVRDIRELARLTQKPITEAVADAVRGELGRARRISTSERDARLKAVEAAVSQFRRASVVGPMLDERDLYDEDGLPR